VADELSKQVDELLGVRTEMVAAAQRKATSGDAEAAEAVCTCVSGIPVASVVVGDQTVELVALPAIFALFREEGKSPDDGATADELVHQIKLYNSLATEHEGALRQAVLQEYARFWAEAAPTGQ
jgi:hypothetical protein